MSSSNIIQRARQIALDTEQALANSRMIIALTSERMIYSEVQVFQRRYFLGSCADGTEVLFVTTNENPEYPDTSLTIGQHYCVLEDFESLLDDLNTSSLLNYLREGVHGPPRYVYYDIDFMDDRFKAYFYTHLESDICGYSEEYLQQHFDEHDMERVAYWIAHLEKDQSGDNSIYRRGIPL